VEETFPDNTNAIVAPTAAKVATPSPVKEQEKVVLSEAAADSPYNQPGADIPALEASNKKTWAEEVYLYLVN